MIDPEGEASTKCWEGRGKVESEKGTMVTGKMGPKRGGEEGVEKHWRSTRRRRRGEDEGRESVSSDEMDRRWRKTRKKSCTGNVSSALNVELEKSV